MVSEFVWPLVLVAIASLIIFVGLFLVWRTIKERKSGFLVSDERKLKITQKAAYYSWYVGIFYMIAVLLVYIIGREFFELPVLDEMVA